MDSMVSNGQHVVNMATDEVDAALAGFVADVLELAGLFQQVAGSIAREEGCSQALWYAMSVFSGEPTTVARGARRLGTSRQALQRTTNQLLERGLAVLEPNADHRSSPWVRLTAAGREALARISERASRQRQSWFADHEVGDLQAAHSEVQRLCRALRAATG